MAKVKLQTNINKIYMCSPSNFEVTYVINPWMENNVKNLNKILAEKQWHDLHEIVNAHCDVEVVDTVKDLPDMVFIANAALFIENKSFIATFRHPERQGETALWHSWFSSRGYDVFQLPSNQFFEGEGDALYDSIRQCIWQGYSQRSSKEASTAVQDFFATETIPLELVSNRFYHLDTCFSLLSGGHLIYVPEAFSPAALKEIEARITPELRIPITFAEAHNFTCNIVNINDVVVCNKADARIIDTLSDFGYTVKETSLSEFIKAGGAAKCLVLTHYNK